MHDDDANDATVREWAWTLEGRDDQRRIARRAALRSVHVWEEVPASSLVPFRGLGRVHDIVATPRRVLTEGPDADGLDATFRALLDLQHQLAYGDGHGPHEFGSYDVAYPPYEIDPFNATRWLYALSSTVHALAAALWTPDQVPAIDDAAEHEAQRAAGPILATVESCVASFVACPSESLAVFVSEVCGPS
jgi:hypothetical protein